MELERNMNKAIQKMTMALEVCGALGEFVELCICELQRIALAVDFDLKTQHAAQCGDNLL